MKLMKLKAPGDIQPSLKITFKSLNRLVVRNREACTVIPFSDIVYLKSDSNYTEIHTKNSKQFLASKTLKSVESRLNNQFIRVHQSYVINMLYISKFIFNDGLILQDNIRIPVSNSMRKKVNDLLS